MKRGIATIALALGMCAAVPFFGVTQAHAASSYNDPGIQASTSGSYSLAKCGPIYTCFSFSNSVNDDLNENEINIPVGPMQDPDTFVSEHGTIQFVNRFGALNMCARAKLSATLSDFYIDPITGHANSNTNYVRATGSICIYNDSADVGNPDPTEAAENPDILIGTFSYSGPNGGGTVSFRIGDSSGDTDVNLLAAGIPTSGEYFNDYNGGVNT